MEMVRRQKRHARRIFKARFAFEARSQIIARPANPDVRVVIEDQARVPHGNQANMRTCRSL